MCPSHEAVSGPAPEEPLCADDLARRIGAGSLSAPALVDDCLQRIDVAAWTHLDAAAVVARCEEMDGLRVAGKPTGRLHGVPIGVADVFAPAASRIVTSSTLPMLAAPSMGEQPGQRSVSRISRSAPSSMSASTASGLSCRTAAISAVCPEGPNSLISAPSRIAFRIFLAQRRRPSALPPT